MTVPAGRGLCRPKALRSLAPPSVHSSVSSLFCAPTAWPAWDLRGELGILPWATGAERPAAERGEPASAARRGGGDREARADSGAEGHPSPVREHRGEESAGGRRVVQVQGAGARGGWGWGWEGLEGWGTGGKGPSGPLTPELPTLAAVRGPVRRRQPEPRGPAPGQAGDE